MSILKHNLQNQPISNNPMMSQIKGFMNMINSSQNPSAMLNNMAMQNPALNQIMQMCRGQNPKDIFYKMCSERGVNPETILNQLK